MNMIAYTRLLTLLGAVLLSGCASTFATTWKDPNATPLEFKSQKVVAIVLLKDESARRLAEDRLAQQIAVRGAEGRTMYSLVPNATPGNEQQTRAALEAAGVKGAIVMRPINVDEQSKSHHRTRNNPMHPSGADTTAMVLHCPTRRPGKRQ